MTEDRDLLLSQLQNIDPENPDSQWQACIELGKIPGAENDQRIVEALVRALEPDRFALTRAHAAEVLGNFGIDDDRVIAALLKSMRNDRYHLVRAYAVRSLVNVSKVLHKEKKENLLILPLVNCLTSDPSFGPRIEAAEGLKTICKESDSEICIAARAAMEARIDGEKGKREESLSRRVQIETSPGRFPRGMIKMPELQARINKHEQDADGLMEKADKILLDKGNSGREESSLTKSLSQNY